jgi:ribosomal protein L11 methyltransferase
LVLAELLELTPSGVEEVELDDGVLEYAIYGASGELPSIPAVTVAAGSALVEVAAEEIADDWQERWRQFHRPLVLDSRLAVRPPWEPPAATDIDVVIDPGQAFGTGSHATTRLCLELMLELAPGMGPFVDVGCGSGVLAITAAKLGWEPVLALDNDPAAVRAATENANRNRVDIEVRRFDLRVDQIGASTGRTVAANLLAPLLKVWAQRLQGDAAAPDQLIAGGLLSGELDEVAAAFAPVGLQEVRRCVVTDWAALLLERAPTPW